MALISFKKTFDSKVTIPTELDADGNVQAGVEVPIHVMRLNRKQLQDLEEGWDSFCEMPRGTLPPTKDATPEQKAAYRLAREEWQRSIRDEQFKYLSNAIESYVTIDEGIFDEGGVAIVDGAGLMRVFYARLDVLGALVTAIRIENRLTPTLAKNSKSLRDSGTGSARSSEARSGERPEPVVKSAESSNSAPSGDATASPDASETDGAGVSGAVAKIH